MTTRKDYLKPALSGMMFVNVHDDGHVTMRTVLDPDTSTLKKWETIASTNLLGEDVERGQHVEMAAALASQLASRLGGMRATMLLQQQMPLAEYAKTVPDAEHVDPRERQCAVCGCKSPLNLKYGDGTHCYRHRGW